MALPENGYTQPVEIVVGGTLPRVGWVQPVDVISGGMTIGALVTGGTPGSVLFVDVGGVLGQNNASFFWDNANLQLQLLGTANPQLNLLYDSTHNATFQVTSTGLLTISGAGASGGAATIAQWLNVGTATDATAQGDFAAGLLNVGRIRFHQATPELNIYDASNIERFRFDAVNNSLRVGVAVLDSDVTNAFGVPRCVVTGNNNNADSFVNIGNANNAIGAHFNFCKTRSASGNDANTIVANGDELGVFNAYGADGASYRLGASIKYVVNGTPGVNDMPTEIQFYTRPQGGAFTQGFTIDRNQILIPAGALATGMTKFFINIPGAAGAPTGVPATTTGFPLYWDSTNLQLYVYTGGAWKKSAAFT